MSSLLNRQNVRKLTFDVLKSERPALADKLVRFSDENFAYVEAAVRKEVIRQVRALTSVGATIKFQ